jgi:hypothetical protein
MYFTAAPGPSPSYPMTCPGFAERWAVWCTDDGLGCEPGDPEINVRAGEGCESSNLSGRRSDSSASMPQSRIYSILGGIWSERNTIVI